MILNPMSRQQRLHAALSMHLEPMLLSIDNETHQHSVPVGSESHFKILIVSTRFQSLNRVARHRLVNHIVQNEFETGLHALSLHLYTPEEWEQKCTPVQASPTCKGGSRHESNI